MSETQPDLLYSEVEEELRASVRALLTNTCPAEVVLGRVEPEGPDDQVTDTALWRDLAELGVAGLPVPERLGGAGATLRESAVVAEELGRSVAPLPFLGSAVLATSALLELADGAEGREAARETLAALASGERTAALAVPLATAPGGAYPSSVRVTGGALTGTVSGVADALTADVLVVPAMGDDGPSLYLVETSEVRRSAVVSLDLTRPLAGVTLNGARGRLLASGAEAEGALGTALVTGASLLSAEQLGVAEWALEATVDYLKTRTQFGRPVGSFQALKHRLADLWVAVSQARAVVRNAVSSAASGTETELNAALAQAFVSGVAVTATEEAVQLHGGIGFTWEHPAHLYLKRAKADSIALGTADRHRLALSRLANLPPAA